MTKSNLRSLLKNTLAQISETGRYHDTYLDHVLEACINSTYYQVHAQNPKALGQYTKRYTIQTATMGDVGRWEYTLPVNLVPLPDKRGGVRNIMLEGAYGTYYFASVTDQEMILMEEAQVDALTTSTPHLIYFSVKENVVEFKYASSVIFTTDTLQFDLLVAFTSLVDTDDVPLPYGKNVEILKMALEIIGVVPPKDLLDNNSDIR